MRLNKNFLGLKIINILHVKNVYVIDVGFEHMHLCARENEPSLWSHENELSIFAKT